ncbi:hypothetical protein FOBRF1_001571 [Fusarium oxysporum]
MQTDLATLPSSLATAYHPGNVYTVSEARPHAEVFVVSANGLFSAAGMNAEILQLAREQDPRRRQRLRLQRRLWPTLFEPSGILAQAQSAFNQDFVFVTLNYRLDAFGWLNSAKVLADGDANAALLDQRFVLQWDQDNIHLFGGSKDHVTIMGESAGRSSVLRHLIAAGAKCKSTKKLFQQAISQSPADIPVATSDLDELYDRLLSILKADNLDAAKSISSAAIITANIT